MSIDTAPDVRIGGPELPQERRLVTEIPGPRSRELIARRAATVADGVGTTLPVFITAAGGGVLVDVDGNSLIDLGSGIAGRQRRQRGSRGCPARAGAGGGVHPHVLHGHAVRELRRGLRDAGAVTPGEHAKKSALFNSGAEAVENAVKIARHATGRRAVAVFDHAYHGRTNLTMAMTAKNMPYKDGFGPFAGDIYRAPMSYPFRDGLSRSGRQRHERSACSSHRWAPKPRLRGDRADPGRRRLRRPCSGIPAGAVGVVRRARDRLRG
jgi:4-aminobutyrate aminotransferase/(S)-3-amino-2-methylpropionate transaminase